MIRSFSAKKADIFLRICQIYEQDL